MATYLKSLAVLIALFGLLLGVGFVKHVREDQAYRTAMLRRERNPGNVLFESEYRIAEATHVFLIYSATGCFLIAVIGGSLLWGVGALHSRLDQRER